jgi:hypothetical protein
MFFLPVSKGFLLQIVPSIFRDGWFHWRFHKKQIFNKLVFNQPEWGWGDSVGEIIQQLELCYGNNNVWFQHINMRID